MSNRILITGGTGFAGSHLVEYLLSQNETELHVTNISDRESYVSSLLSPDQIHKLDLTNKTAVQEIIAKLKPTQIYHLASAAAVGASFSQARTVLESHVALQLNLLEAVQEFAPNCRILAIGSALEYAVTKESAQKPINEHHQIGPISPYAVSKAFQTLLAQSFAHSYQMDVVMVRPFNHIGERQALGFVVADFASQIVAIERGQQEKLSVGNLAAIRDFSDVKDVVRGYYLLMQKGAAAEVYNIGSGSGYSIRTILDWLVAAANTAIPIETDHSKFRPLDIESVIADNSKIKAIGWQPEHDLHDTVLRVLKWWRSQT